MLNPLMLNPLAVTYNFLNTNSIHVLALQETWLAKQELHLLNAFVDYDAFGVSKTDYESSLPVGRNSGGVAFLWNQALTSTFNIRPCDYGHDWLAGLDLIDKVTNVKYSIINVYLPYNCRDNIDLFVECIGILQYILEEMDTTRVMICGDFNCDPRKDDAFGHTLSSFIADLDTSCADVEKLTQDTFTFVSDCWDTTSWIDHCVCTADFVDLIRNMFVDYGLTWSDHRPTVLDLDYSLSPSVSEENQLHWSTSRANWQADSEITKYHQQTDELLHSIELGDFIYCQDPDCRNETHLRTIEDLYNEVVKCLKCSSRPTKQKNFKVVAGWTDYVKDWNDASRESFLLWVNAGKPRNGPVFQLMKRCKARFKYALRQCKRSEESCKADALAKKMLNKHYDAFWKDVKHVNSAKVPLPNNIDEVSGSRDIVMMWRDHYYQMFNLYGNRNPGVYNCAYSENMMVTSEVVADCIKSLPGKKSAGPDSLVGEHF